MRIEKFQERLKEPSTWKGLISVGAAVVMFFTPDHVDIVIQSVLAAIGGIDVMRIEKKK